MTELPDPPIVARARRMALASRAWGACPESGIMNGAWDHGSIVGDYFNDAEQELLREQMEENIPDD